MPGYRPDPLCYRPSSMTLLSKRSWRLTVRSQNINYRLFSPATPDRHTEYFPELNESSMNKQGLTFIAYCLLLLCLSCRQAGGSEAGGGAGVEPGVDPRSEWKQQLDRELPLLGHRNWILVVDKAFPMQTSPGMEVINTDE